MGRLANASVALRGEGTGTLFGLQPTPDVVPDEELYRTACEVLASWFDHLSDEEGAGLAAFVRDKGLHVPIPERFPAPEERAAPVEPATAEQIEAMAQRLLSLTPLFSPDDWVALQGRWDALAAGVEARGGEVQEPPAAEPPARADELARVERDLGRPLPDGLVRAFLNARSVTFAFAYPPHPEAPLQLTEHPNDERVELEDPVVPGPLLLFGGIEGGVWRLDALPPLAEACQAWAGEEPRGEAERLWLEGVPICEVDATDDPDRRSEATSATEPTPRPPGPRRGSSRSPRRGSSRSAGRRRRSTRCSGPARALSSAPVGTRWSPGASARTCPA